MTLILRKMGNPQANQIDGPSGMAFRLHRPVWIWRQTTVPAGPAIVSASAFRNMNSVGKLPSIKAGTPSTVIIVSHRLHLNQ